MGKPIFPKQGDFVWYVPPEGERLPSLVSHVWAEDSVSLLVLQPKAAPVMRGVVKLRSAEEAYAGMAYWPTPEEARRATTALDLLDSLAHTTPA